MIPWRAERPYKGNIWECVHNLVVWNVIRLLAPFPHAWAAVEEWGEETDDISD